MSKYDTEAIKNSKVNKQYKVYFFRNYAYKKEKTSRLRLCVVMHDGNVGRIQEKRVKHEADSKHVFTGATRSFIHKQGFSRHTKA